MAFFDYPRYETPKYKYKVPTYAEVKDWLAKDPTRFGISPVVIQPSVIVWGSEDVWICMNTVDMPGVTDPKIDIHWVHYVRSEDPAKDGKITHIQQIFNKVTGVLWHGSVIELSVDTESPDNLICPHCMIELELVALADRCPNCLYVKNG